MLPLELQAHVLTYAPVARTSCKSIKHIFDVFLNQCIPEACPKGVCVSPHLETWEPVANAIGTNGMTLLKKKVPGYSQIRITGTTNMPVVEGVPENRRCRFGLIYKPHTFGTLITLPTFPLCLFPPIMRRVTVRRGAGGLVAAVSRITQTIACFTASGMFTHRCARIKYDWHEETFYDTGPNTMVLRCYDPHSACELVLTFDGQTFTEQDEEDEVEENEHDAPMVGTHNEILTTFPNGLAAQLYGGDIFLTNV